MSIAGRTAPTRPPRANSGPQAQIDRTAPEFLRQRQTSLDAMVQGYRDGLDPDSPAPSSNRSLSYVHGFNIGQGDHRGKPFHDAATLRSMAEAAVEADALASCERARRKPNRDDFFRRCSCRASHAPPSCCRMFISNSYDRGISPHSGQGKLRS